MKKYEYYYYDEVNDDFANNGIDGKPTPDNFPYIAKNPFYQFFQPIVYYFFLGFFSLIVGCMRVKMVNKKVLKTGRDKKKGYFIYGNHTSWIEDAVTPCMTAFPKPCYTIANPDAISIKGAGMLVRMFGAYPTPNSKQHFKDFTKGIDLFYNKGYAISIFPEAHIWPHYNEIRNFPNVSFTYPVKLNAPCYTKTLVYEPTKKGKLKPVIYFDGPFYPNKELTSAEAKKELRDTIYNNMVETAKKHNSTLASNYSYTKVDSPDQVKSVITKL